MKKPIDKHEITIGDLANSLCKNIGLDAIEYGTIGTPFTHNYYMDGLKLVLTIEIYPNDKGESV